MHLGRLSDIVGHGTGGTCRVEGLGPALPLRPAALLDLRRAGREPGEEGIDVGADLVRCAEAGVGGHLLAQPGPDMLVGVDIGAVGRQADQTHAESAVRR